MKDISKDLAEDPIPYYDNSSEWKAFLSFMLFFILFIIAIIAGYMILYGK